MAKRLALLVKPAAGHGWAARVALVARDRLRGLGHDVRMLVARSPAEAAGQARAAVADGVAGLVAVGGDGVVHVALQAVAGSGVALGVIPAGTGNDAARTLGLPRRRRLRDVLAAADVIHAGATRRIDAGRVGDRWFLSVLSSGFDSLVTERADRMIWLSGRARYTLAIAAQLRVFRPVPYVLTLDGQRWETDAMLVAVGNGRSYGGGMLVCPGADMTDGLLDVTILRPLPTASFVRLLPSVYRGTHVRHPAVVTSRARSVTLSAAGMTGYADGERVGPLPLTAHAVPGAVTVYVPCGPTGVR